MTNTFEYAYPGGAGEVHVRLSQPEPGRIRIEVADRGQGLPPGFDAAQPRGSLGFRLIQGFVRQIGGTLAVASNDPGVRFVLEMPLAA